MTLKDITGQATAAFDAEKKLLVYNGFYNVQIFVGQIVFVSFLEEDNILSCASHNSWPSSSIKRYKWELCVGHLACLRSA